MSTPIFSNRGISRLFLIDAHVHLYDCFDLSDVFDTACRNFRAEASRANEQDNFDGLLLLSEASNDKCFDRLFLYADCGEAIGRASNNAWRFYHTDEDCSLLARDGRGNQLTLIAGRQIVTKERLEVLALATCAEFENGVPICGLIEAINESGGIPVLPWGVGKWFGERGRIIQSLISSTNEPKFFLGDNGGRPIFWPRPAIFRRAESQGVRILPGSDPLPLPTEGMRCGGFGFAMTGLLSQNKPKADIKRLIEDCSAEIRPYGNLESPLRFCRNQLRLRLQR